MYLRELRLAQMERMMEEFIHGVDIYLSCVRDASDEVVKKKVRTVHCMPHIIATVGVLTEGMKDMLLFLVE
jgi:hypothetical protein